MCLYYTCKTFKTLNKAIMSNNFMFISSGNKIQMWEYFISASNSIIYGLVFLGY